MNIKEYFGLVIEPFTQAIKVRDLMNLDGMTQVKKRLDYCFSIQGNSIITGDVGSGKSTSLRWSLSHYHGSEYAIVSVVANSASPLEFYRQVAWQLGLTPSGIKLSLIQKEIRETIIELVRTKRMRVVIVIDEANLLRQSVLAELHTLGQFEYDSKPHLSLVLCGQSSLLDNLFNRRCEPLASRIVARTHLKPLNEPKTREYIEHHMKIAGATKQYFDDTALTAIYQGSAGILRRINHLCRGSLLAASFDESKKIDAEHVRKAASELI